MKKRILVSIAFFYPNIGGYENYIYELYSRLTDQFTIDILVLDTKKSPSFEEWECFNIYRLDSWSFVGGLYPVPKFNIKNLKILKKILRNNYLFVNTHTRLFVSSILGLMIAKYKKTKLVNTEHGNDQVNYLKNPFYNFIAHLYDLTIGKLIIKLAFINVGVSKDTCKFLEDMGAKKIHLVSNGVDVQKFKPIDTNLKQELNIPRKSIIITFIGRLVYPKGVQDLISCFLKIKKMDPNLQLLIVGDGDYKKKLLEQAGSNKDIRFLGFRTDVLEILNISDVVVNPSHSEALPTVVLEAGSVGIPTIATDVGGTREILNKEVGYLVEKGDENAICDSILDISRGNRFNKDDIRKNIITKYSWDEISKRFNKIIQVEFSC